MNIIALDLEQTLISNAVSQIPRPWLYEFLVSCEALAARIVIFTAVPEKNFRRIARTLVEEKFMPSWFEKIEYVFWDMKTKNLNFIDSNIDERIVLVDDFSGYVHPMQEKNWIPIDPFVAPYDQLDVELWRVFQILYKKFKTKDRECPELLNVKNSPFLPLEFGSWSTSKIEYAANNLMEGNYDAALVWLRTPLEILGGKPPIEHADSKLGQQEVMDLIGRLEHGVFS